MADEEGNVSSQFFQLVISLQSAAWFQMGKTVSPVSGKIERNLEEARFSIDLLTMLQEKTKGNLSDDEKKILDNAVYTLQMNYIDEMKLDKEKEEKGGAQSKSEDNKSADEGDSKPKEKPPSETSGDQ